MNAGRRGWRPAAAWGLLAASLAGCALAGWPVAHEALDWQPALAIQQPWRAFTAIAVHYSVLHLFGNLAGVAALALLGWAAAAPSSWAWAWFASWPLTQFGLWFEPALAHYGGLSGVLHAGVAIVAVGLIARGRQRSLVGWALLIGVAIKIASEAPWGAPLRQTAGWDFPVAPLAHLSGAVAGIACALVVALMPARATGHADRLPS